jgi:hypothetical protein
VLLKFRDAPLRVVMLLGLGHVEVLHGSSIEPRTDTDHIGRHRHERAPGSSAGRRLSQLRRVSLLAGAFAAGGLLLAALFEVAHDPLLLGSILVRGETQETTRPGGPLP